MISYIKKIITDHWRRKLISLALAIIIWFVTHHSITSTKVITAVPVRITHIAEGKTVEGMLGNGLLTSRINLTITGNKEILEDLSPKNLEVVIDASEQPDQSVVNINKKHLRCSVPGFDLNQAVIKISSPDIFIKQTKLISEKIPVIVTKPNGEPPEGYQVLDVWPYKLHLTVTGAEEVINKLKERGIKLTFNMKDITKEALDNLRSETKSDEVSYLVPNEWKKVSVPQISDNLIEIDDPQAKNLRIDFSKQDFLPIGTNIPITLFFPPKHSATLNPDTYSIATNEYIIKKNGIRMLSMPLYAKGISRLFLETIKDMLQITVVVSPKSEQEKLIWNVQLISQLELENRYVAKMIAASAEDSDVLPRLREDHLRNRFRSYMNKFRFYTANHQKLNLNIHLLSNYITVIPENNSNIVENEPFDNQ